MGTRSDIIVHRADGKWHRIYCHWDGYLSHNGKILFDAYTDQKHADALVALGNLSVLGPKIGTKHPFDKPDFNTPAYAVHEKKYDGMCTSYIRDRGLGNWHYAKTKAEFLKLEAGEIGDTLQAVWPDANTGTEFTYVWDQGKWYVADPDEGTQAMIDLGDALSGKRTLTPNVKAFGGPMVIGKHLPHDPASPDNHKWSSGRKVT